MNYVVFNTNTKLAHRRGKTMYSSIVFETERGAKMVCTKMNRFEPGHIVITEDEYSETYRIKPKMVERVNLMSGEKYMEAEDTPGFCSPSSESYWSM